MRPLATLGLALLTAPVLARAADAPNVPSPAPASPASSVPPASPASPASSAPAVASPPASSLAPAPVASSEPPGPPAGGPLVAPTLEDTSVKWYRRRHNPDIHARYGWSVPDYLLFQTGGYLGMFTVGLGFGFFHDVLHVDGRFGYTPYYRGAPAVREGALLVSVRPLRFDMGKDQNYLWNPIYVGGGPVLISSDSTFRAQPSIYPKGYYPSNGVQLMVLIGTEFAFRTDGTSIIRRHGIYSEAVTGNQYLGAILKNRDLPLLDAFSVSFGYRMSL